MNTTEDGADKLWKSWLAGGSLRRWRSHMHGRISGPQDVFEAAKLGAPMMTTPTTQLLCGKIDCLSLSSAIRMRRKDPDLPTRRTASMLFSETSFTGALGNAVNTGLT
jgi:hypothetical protein